MSTISTARGIRVGMDGDSATAAAGSRPVDSPRTHVSDCMARVPEIVPAYLENSEAGP